MGKVCSHLSEEERQVIQIEIGNGTGVRRIGAMAWTQRLRHQPGDQAQHVVPVQRERVAAIIPDRTADESVGAQLAMFSPLPAGARASVTHDNGAEFARHARLRDELGMATYFADPYSSWQRGSNENRNGMIRRYLPKRAVIDPGMAREVQEIVDETDNRPMRVLGYRTPAEAFTDELLNLKTQQGCCTYK